MKKFVILGAILAIAQFAQAQTEKGSQNVGVNLQFSRSTLSGKSIYPFDNTVTNIDQKYTALAIGPNYSYFVADGLDLGAALNYSYYKADNGDGYYPTKTVDNSFGGSIFLRKYIMYQNRVGIRTGPYLGYSHSSVKSTSTGANSINDSDRKSNTYYGGVNLELLLYPVKQLGVSLMLANLNYSHYNTDSGKQGKTNGDSVNANLVNNGLGLSVFYVLGK
ncbi:hypothetical protein A0256_18860 [Mucilaginibacter sp. PAMC 26640]|nr:hypothetical protein A0256_18860 [Mucilaginibacter sp. PAMC 26640]